MEDPYVNEGPNYAIRLEHMRWGRFSTRPETGADDPAADLSEVLFVQTAFNLKEMEDSSLVEALAPVRESIAPELLSFDSLIQRDLDDERVATSLIPYLLAPGGASVRMFPSILVLILPRSSGSRIDHLYMNRHDLPPVQQGTSQRRLTMAYGDGDRQWAFEFSRLQTAKGAYLPYGAHLKVNPQACSLAVVDGQHRAMAVLALWRNLNKWPDVARPFKDFYANHSREKLKDVDLSGLSLPVTVCFFPQLHSGKKGLSPDRDSVIRAARKLFLDVNRNAKTPSRARQVLLDDQRLTSELVRTIMTRIKDKEPGAPGLKLGNLYYDQMQDNESSSAMPKLAATSVLHIHAMVRMLLLGKRPQGSERAVTRADFQVFDPLSQDNNRTLVEMLSLESLFTGSAGWKDETIPTSNRPQVVQQFMLTWGGLIGEFLDGLPAFDALAHGAEVTRQMLDASTHDEDPIVKRMLFEGQGLRAVHESIQMRMDMDGSDREFPEYPQTTVDAFGRQWKRLLEHEQRTVERAAERFWGQGDEWPKWLSDEDRAQLVRAYSSELLGLFFKTKAFQVAVIMTLGHVERKLGASQRELFWRFGVGSMLLQKLFAYFRPDGFPGPNLGAERKVAWATTVLEHRGVSGFYRNGYYRYVRDTLQSDLKDGKWQFVKCCLVEILRAPLASLEKVEAEWLERSLAANGDRGDLESLLAKVNRHLTDAAELYRDRLLTHDFERARNQYRKDNGKPADAAMEQQFHAQACNRLADRLHASLQLPKGELEAIRSRPMKAQLLGDSGAEEAPEEEPGTSELAG